MRIFSVTQEVALDTNKFRRKYLAVSNPEAAQVDRLYLEVGEEVKLVLDKLKVQYAEAHPELALDDDAIKKLDAAPVGLQLASEQSLLPWPFFPARLGRISTRFAGEDPYFHSEAQVLAAQLHALRARKPEKQHFRFAIVNGFGSNLGDCTIGITAFRQVASILAQHVPSLSCDILFGPGTSAATADILGYEPCIERLLYQAPTVAEFAQYDGYFDFTGLINMPKYDQLPTVDWYLWWCGLDPQTIPAEHKRNRGHIRWDAWNAVQALLRDKPGKKLLFNPKASVPLRTMPEDVALKFAKRLLELEPEIKLVIDQPMEFKHKRLIDLSGQIDSPEKFKALVGQMDGVITVNSFASHVADLCSTPAVHMCSCLSGSFYPYYPFSAAINPPGYEQLPAHGKVKVAEDEWEKIKGDYQAAWARLNPAEVLKLLKEKMAQRQEVQREPRGLALVGERKQPSCISGTTPRLELSRLRIAPEHVRASERFAHLTQHILLPGSNAVMACAPDPSLPVTLAQRVAPYGELVVFEPRALLARAVEASLFTSGTLTARVLTSMATSDEEAASLHALDPWSEISSTHWGNSHRAIEVPNQTVDALQLETCACLMVQSPMSYTPFLAGALQTLKRCRPFVFISPISKEEARTACLTAMQADYEFWAEAALPGQDMNLMLLIGVPKEKQVKIDGFFKVEVNV